MTAITAIVHTENSLNGGDTLLSAKEVAEYLRVSPYTVTQMIRHFTLDGYKIGKAWRIPRSSFLKYLHERQSERKTIVIRDIQRGDLS